MTTRRNITHKKRKRFVKRYGGKTGKKWTTAIAAAQKTLRKTGSYEKAKQSLRKQALSNAKKLFGSVRTMRV
jgi:hypothetical protein